MRPLAKLFGLSIFLGCFHLTSLGDEATNLQRAWEASRESNHQKAIQICSEIIKANSNNASAYYLRGRAHFQSGKLKQSFSDFEKYTELAPEKKSRLWERGITCYYVKEFQKGAKQFELYQTFHSEDVENAVWHILCKSGEVGFQQASQNPLTVRNDRRVPMSQIYELFLGKRTPESVLKVANEANSKNSLNYQRFYAHLYIGLYFEINKNAKLAKQHIAKAVQHKIDHYMWDVANIHFKLLKMGEQ